jgi:hypothetical protein
MMFSTCTHDSCDHLGETEVKHDTSSFKECFPECNECTVLSSKFSIVLIPSSSQELLLRYYHTRRYVKCIIAVNCKKNQSIIKTDQSNCFYITIQYLKYESLIHPIFSITIQYFLNMNSSFIFIQSSSHSFPL